MKWVPVIVVLLGAILKTPLLAQSLPSTSISLEAKQVAAKRQMANSFKTDWGSYDKSFNREREIEITVRTLKAEPAKLKVHTYFLGKRVTGQEKYIVADKSQDIDLPGRGVKVWNETSGAITATDTNLALAKYRSTSGSTIIGWVVTVEDAATEKLIAVRASEEPFAVLGRDGTIKTLSHR